MCAKVLVVDDDPVNADLLGYLLRAFGHDATLVLGGEGALHAVEAEVPDLVLCDIQMPHIDGFELLRRLRQDERLVATPIVGVTALAMVGDREKILGAGFDGYLTKPISPETFIGEVEKYLPASLARKELPPMTHSSPSLERRVEAARRSGGYALLVDDTKANLELLGHLITSLGVEVRTASTVEGGLRIARNEVPRLIVSDVHMPEHGGLHLLAAVRSDAALRRVPFLLISSTAASGEEQRQAAVLGVDGFLLRPLEAEALLEHLARWMPMERER